MNPCIICRKVSRPKFLYKNFTILECLSCKMIFVDPNQIDKNYRRQYLKNESAPVEYYQNAKRYDQKSFLKRIMYLDKFFPNKGLLLEVGSSIGTFLEIARDYGWDAVGVEPNKFVSKIFHRKRNRITVFNCFFDEKFVSSHKRKYDLIYSSDVIEHTKDPVSFLKLSRKLLKREGLIVTITPDFDNLLSKLFQIKPTEHLIYLNRDNIDILYKRAELKIIETRNIHRERSIRAMFYSTTFTDSNNRKILAPMIKFISNLKIYFLVEMVLSLFKEDLMIISKRN